MTFLWFVLYLFYFPVVLASIFTDYQALCSLKASLEDPQGRLQDWQGNATRICSWRGITCDENQQSVTGLNLSSLSLSGNVAPEVGNLCSLTHVSLSQNRLITGPLPQFPCATSLQVLHLNDNNFTGGIPPGLGKHIQMVDLNIEQNALLGGRIPTEVCNLVNLKEVSFALLGVEGSIPDCLGQLHQLQVLDARGNILTGSIPATLSRLKNLEILDFSMNGLTGAIPPELGNLSSLRILRLWTNNLSGNLPPQLGNLSRLTHFDMSVNQLEGPVPEEYAALNHLQEFRILNNSLSGKFPSWLADLHHLRDISLTFNKFEGEIPQHLGMNSALASMDLGNNKFTGPIPPGLCNGKALFYLILLDNQFTGSLPIDLQGCRSLTRLRLESNNLSGSLNLSLPLLDFTTLGSNSFNGTLNLSPSMIHLEHLDVSSNHMIGELPASLGSLVRLQVLNLQNNEFSGQIPSLGNLSNLSDLYLNSNRLEGEIPSSLSRCQELTIFNASRNHLEGRIPISLTELPKVSNIDLSHNYLSGGVPETVSINLLTLDISYNNLSGKVPSSLTSRQLKVAGNQHLCGTHIPGLRSCNSTYSERRRPGHQGGNIVLVVIFTVTIVFFVGMIVLLVIISSKRFRNLEQPLSWNIVNYHKPPVRLQDILDCIDKEDNLISKSVYRSRLSDGREVAVKRLEGADYQSFLSEVATLGQVRHRNIVKLFASCSNGSCHLVVYEYRPGGNLRDYLQTHEMDWKTRLQVINGIAQALFYLHHGCEFPVVHRDIKCENILLDAELDPQLGDFGLAIMLQKDVKSCTASRLAGTFGYIPPEYAYTLKVGVRGDVYSFGILMLELLTAKHARYDNDGLNLIEWVKSEPPELMEHLKDLENPNLDSDLAYRVLMDIAIGCTQEVPSKRLSMQQVVNLLSLKFSHAFKDYHM